MVKSSKSIHSSVLTFSTGSYVISISTYLVITDLFRINKMIVLQFCICIFSSLRINFSYQELHHLVYFQKLQW